jgi:hypothetical protein
LRTGVFASSTPSGKCTDGRRLRRAIQEGDAPQGGRDLLEQVQGLGCHRKFLAGKAGDVAARLRQARHKALADRIGDVREQNRDRAGRPPNGRQDWRACDKDQVRP